MFSETFKSRHKTDKNLLKKGLSLITKKPIKKTFFEEIKAY
jgi:hypothetical protein